MNIKYEFYSLDGQQVKTSTETGVTKAGLPMIGDRITIPGYFEHNSVMHRTAVVKTVSHDGLDAHKIYWVIVSCTVDVYLLTRLSTADLASPLPPPGYGQITGVSDAKPKDPNAPDSTQLYYSQHAVLRAVRIKYNDLNKPENWPSEVLACKNAPELRNDVIGGTPSPCIRTVRDYTTDGGMGCIVVLLNDESINPPDRIIDICDNGVFEADYKVLHAVTATAWDCTINDVCVRIYPLQQADALVEHWPAWLQNRLKQDHTRDAVRIGTTVPNDDKTIALRDVKVVRQLWIKNQLHLDMRTVPNHHVLTYSEQHDWGMRNMAPAVFDKLFGTSKYKPASPPIVVTPGVPNSKVTYYSKRTPLCVWFITPTSCNSPESWPVWVRTGLDLKASNFWHSDTDTGPCVTTVDGRRHDLRKVQAVVGISTDVLNHYTRTIDVCTMQEFERRYVLMEGHRYGDGVYRMRQITAKAYPVPENPDNKDDWPSWLLQQSQRVGDGQFVCNADEGASLLQKVNNQTVMYGCKLPVPGVLMHTGQDTGRGVWWLRPEAFDMLFDHVHPSGFKLGE